MRIFHFSDPHAGGPAEDWRAYIDKRWVGVFNYRFRRRFRHDLSCLEKAVAYILKTGADAAVCTGDLTSAGQPGEFAKVRKILAPLRDSGIPLLYLPGNHDCYVNHPPCVQAVREAVEDLSCGRISLDTLPQKLIIQDVEFLLLNTSAPSNLLCSWGFVKPEDATKISAWCQEPKIRPRIMATHYPMYEDHPLLRFRHRLFGQRKLQELLENGSIDLALCGHVHHPSQRKSPAWENCAGSVTRNGSMSKIELKNGTISIESIQL